MNNEAFSDIRALLAGGVPALPQTYDAFKDYVEWYKHMLKSFRAMFTPLQLPEEKAEIWSVLNPYLDQHPGLLKTLTGMAASQTILRGETYPWSLQAVFSSYSLVAYHNGFYASHPEVRNHVINGFPPAFKPIKTLLPTYKEPFPLDCFAQVWGGAPRPYDIRDTVFGDRRDNRALRSTSRDVFVAAHNPATFFERVASGELRGYTKTFILSDEGSDWLTFAERRQGQEYDEDFEYSPENRWKALMWKYEHNVYATVLTDASGIQVYLPDVCYDTPPEEGDRGFFYDCYE